MRVGQDDCAVGAGKLVVVVVVVSGGWALNEGGSSSSSSNLSRFAVVVIFVYWVLGGEGTGAAGPEGATDD